MRICMENEQKEVESMPNIKSSKKDVISSKIAYEKNKADKSELKTNLNLEGLKGITLYNAARKKSSMTLKLNKLA